MARLCIMEDIPAQICWQYLHGGFDEVTNVGIYNIVYSILPDKRIAIRMILEIAYRIGYGKSELMDDMSEVSYKKRKNSKIARKERK